MKKRVLIILIIALVALVLFFLGETDQFLGLFGLSSASILLYILKVIFDDQITTGTKKLLKMLGVQKNDQDLGLALNEEAKDFQLRRLKKGVQKVCSDSISRIEEGNIKFIRNLNWEYQEEGKYQKEGKKPKEHRGTLETLIQKTEEFSKNRFAIIGPAGVGKTSAIFDYILHQLNDENTKQIPVYFSLSSWKKEQSILQWLQDELGRLYRINKKPAEHLIRSQKIIPILDGLDQMSQEFREHCAVEIDAFSRVNPIALTSRLEVFEEISAFLKKKDVDIDEIFHTYKLMPLLPEQVLEVTDTLETRENFKRIFEKSSRLQSFARFPMGLYLLSVTIKDIKPEEIEALEKGSDLDVFYKLWHKYDNYVYDDPHYVTHRELRYDRDKIRYWLSHMAKESSSTFFIEDLQPLYLSTKKMRLQYYLLSRLVMAYFISIAVGFFMSGPLDFLNASILSGFTATLVIYLFRNRARRKREEQTSSLRQAMDQTKGENKAKHYISNIIWYLVPCVFVLWIYFGFSAPRSPNLKEEMFLDGLFSATEANMGILIGILMALIFGLRGRWQKINIDIRSVEKLNRNWKGFFRHGTVGGIILGLLLIILVMVITFLFNNSGFGMWLEKNLYIKNVYLLSFLFGFIFGFVLFGIMGYLKDSDTLIATSAKKKDSFTPNYGIKRSFSNAKRAFIIVSVVMIILISGTIGIIEHGETSSLIKAAKTGIAFGVLGFLWFGGLDVISHYSLRFIIFLDNTGPLRFSKYLEDASNLRFIKAAGAGYEFLHPTLIHYFQTNSFPAYKHKKMKNYLIPTFCLLLCFPIFWTLNQRFSKKTFWQDPNGFSVTSYTPYVRKNPKSNNEWLVKGIPEGKTLALELKATGKVKVGTFTGNVSSSGTEASFFGFGIGDTYDRKGYEEARHASLIVQKKEEGSWKAFPKQDFFTTLNKERSLWIKVKNEERLAFVVNDSEWQNNKHIFDIHIDTLKTVTEMNIISHRGAAGLAPENSIEAVKKGIELGAEKIEIDVHQTKDGALVVMHDKKVNRTTNGKGRIKDLSLEEIKNLKIEHDFEEDFENLSVPTLEEVLGLIKESQTDLLLEVKNPKDYPAIGDSIVSTIEKMELTERVEVFSFDKKFVKKFKADYPHFKTGLFVLGPLSSSDVPGIDAIGVYYRSLLWFKSYHRKLKERGLKVYAWNVNSENSMQRLIRMNIDAIITDHPEVLIETMGN